MPTARRASRRSLLTERARIYARHLAHLPWDDEKMISAMSAFERAALLAALGAADFARLAEVEEMLRALARESGRTRAWARSR